MPVALLRILLGMCIIEFHMVWVPGSLVAKFARNAAGSQLGLKLKCRTPTATLLLSLKVSKQRSYLLHNINHILKSY